MFFTFCDIYDATKKSSLLLTECTGSRSLLLESSSASGPNFDTFSLPCEQIESREKALGIGAVSSLFSRSHWTKNKQTQAPEVARELTKP